MVQDNDASLRFQARLRSVPGFRQFKLIKRSLNTAWQLLGLTILMIILVEFALTVLFATKDRLLGTPPAVDPRVVAQGYQGADWPIKHFETYQELQTQWWPYVGYRAAPIESSTITINEDGVRQTPLQKNQRNDDLVEIVVLGGSVAWGLGARDVGTIPARVGQHLQHNGIPVEVKNLAQIGYVSTQNLLTLLEELRMGRVPDIVICVDGVNDVLAALQANSAGLPQNAKNRRLEFQILNKPYQLGTQFVRSFIQDSTLKRLAEAVVARTSGSRTEGIRRHYGSKFSDELIKAVLTNYAENLQILDAIAQHYDFQVVCYWQPILFTKRLLTEHESDESSKYNWLRDPLTRTYDRASSVDLSTPNLVYRNVSHLFDTSEKLVFVDFCHLTESASEKLAVVIAEDVIESIKQKRTHKID